MRQGGLAVQLRQVSRRVEGLIANCLRWPFRKLSPINSAFRCEQNTSRQKIWTFYDIYLHLSICYLHLSICSGLLHVLYIIGTDRMSTCIRIIPISKWDLSLACTCMSKHHLVYADIVFLHVDHHRTYENDKYLIIFRNVLHLRAGVKLRNIG